MALHHQKSTILLFLCNLFLLLVKTCNSYFQYYLFLIYHCLNQELSDHPSWMSIFSCLVQTLHSLLIFLFWSNNLILCSFYLFLKISKLINIFTSDLHNAAHHSAIVNYFTRACWNLISLKAQSSLTGFFVVCI